MPSDRARTARLVPLPNAAQAATQREQLRLAPSPRLSSFLAAAARLGLDAPLAVRLALERALALCDAHALCIDVERARATLNSAAASARAEQGLSASQARYVRSLLDQSPRVVPDVEQGLVVVVADDVLTRARDRVPQDALHTDAVPEMLAWERAARLQGRTMAEWALSVLAASLIAA